MCEAWETATRKKVADVALASRLSLRASQKPNPVRQDRTVSQGSRGPDGSPAFAQQLVSSPRLRTPDSYSPIVHGQWLRGSLHLHKLEPSLGSRTNGRTECSHHGPQVDLLNSRATP